MKFPGGIKNAEHFGTGRGKIHATKLADGRVAVKRYRTTYVVSEEFYLERLSVAKGYGDTGKYFKGFFWGTEEGIKKKDSIYMKNFNRAIRTKYGWASPKLRNYATEMFKNLGMNGRDAFTDKYPNVLEEVFKYEDFTDPEYEGDRTQSNKDINYLITALESMYSSEEVQAMRQKFNYGWYQRRYGLE